ncbi:hypothetical protein [Citrobacter farmeri]|uniref:hypothetical protein n=1 Tax=Citrobacter farmeri TaxID=67824 RepID=UPI001901A913|nr:hypothetical protein [Citrobacter farmeri]MBJ9134411.1 hypothetical protein [Citrobacter farmeri]
MKTTKYYIRHHDHFIEAEIKEWDDRVLMTIDPMNKIPLSDYDGVTHTYKQVQQIRNELLEKNK